MGSIKEIKKIARCEKCCNLTEHNITFDPALPELRTECTVCHTVNMYKNRALICIKKGCGQINEITTDVVRCSRCGKAYPIGPKMIKVEIKEGKKRMIVFKEGKWYNIGEMGYCLCPTCHMPLPGETDDPNMREVQTPFHWKIAGRHYGCVKKGGKYAESFGDALNGKWLIK